MAYVQFQKPKDPSLVREKIDKTIERYTLELELINKAFKILEDFEGKQITKRIQTAFKKALPEYTIYYDLDNWRFGLSIWGNGIDYNERMSIDLGRKEDPIIQEEFLKETNRCYTLNEGRLVRLKEGRKKIRSFCERYNNTLKKAQELSKEAGEYEMEYDFDIGLERR